MSLGTKEIAERLGISQSTLKRWVACFPNVFPKDRLGHYLFTEQEFKLLEKIKEEVRRGVQLDKIVLPGKQATPAGRTESAALPPDMDMLHLRVDHLERAVAQKADEVVTAQLYQQRQELEELRRMVVLLSDAVEGMRQSAVSRDADSKPAVPEPARPEAGTASRSKKRKKFRLFGG
ncbi:MerR family transcriptional regulator [Cohnella zeiphila]|uniref:MerR family transcriptional regulator n=1 Tax=Cohnella zeiphila TaxID=2761120 RepID=A0A7X0SW43_9BACL|nr:MerR family transcriptional regulator [Cohnella zeiphila]MBB6736005.1 MerR family transcriptional regulator [Cohnella zeiphila]